MASAVRKLASIVAGVLGSVLLASGAGAVVTEYSDRAAFEASAGALSIQDFEAFVSGGTFEGVFFDFGDFSAFHGVNGRGGGGVGAVSFNGSAVSITASTGVLEAELIFVFDHPVTAVGFDADNLADQRVEVVAFDNSALDAVPITDPLDQVRFWGFISDTPFTTMTFTLVSSPSGTDGFSIDDMTYSAPPAVPVLGNAALVVMALSMMVGAGIFARRVA